jgi:hypothetical protein
VSLAPYVDEAQAAASLPAATDYAAKAKAALAQMYKNDELGCCVISGKFHALGVWSGNKAGTPIIATDAEVVAAYHGICGPGDNGCVIEDVLDHWQNAGITMGGKVHKIDGYVGVDPSNPTQIKTAVVLFTSLALALNLPAAWEGGNDGDIWDIPRGLGARVVGGHDVEAVDYNETGVVVSTWGSTRTITWRAMASRYVTQALASKSPDWYGDDGMAPCGVNAAALDAALAAFKAGQVPPIDPTPVPTPPPGVTLTLDSLIEAVEDGVNAGRPYPDPATADQVALAIIDSIRAAWPAAV